MQNRLLISGFPPFGDHQENPSSIMADMISSSTENNHIFSCIVDCNWRLAFPQLKAAVEQYKPDLIISLGLSAAAEKITIETVFYNENNLELRDNAGDFAESARIREDGPESYHCTFSDELYDQLKAEMDLNRSTDAGRYLCNNLAYQTKYYLKQSEISSRSIFIHLPQFRQISEDRNTAEIRLQNDLERIIETAAKLG